MDTLTHTFFGLSLYGAMDKREVAKPARHALLFTALAGSQIPDIDVVSALWDTAGRYQMWHRGITHSLFLIPVWAALILVISRLIWGKHASRSLFGVGLLAVFIHNTSDLFNAWGTGYLEPFSPVRISFGTIPIVDPVFWLLMLFGFAAVFFRLIKRPGYQVYRAVWLLMVAHILAQSIQGYVLYQQAQQQYEQVALAADYIPGHFTVIGKNDGQVVLEKRTVWSGQKEIVAQLESQDDADLERLFAARPEAKTLYEWAPFVVVVDDGKRLGIYDPRFYRNGQSFLFEFIEGLEH